MENRKKDGTNAEFYQNKINLIYLKKKKKNETMAKRMNEGQIINVNRNA